MHGVEPNNDIEELEKMTENAGNFQSGKHNVQKCLVSILEIGLKCSEASPNDRMHMNEVLRQLQLIKDAFLAA